MFKLQTPGSLAGGAFCQDSESDSIWPLRAGQATEAARQYNHHPAHRSLEVIMSVMKTSSCTVLYINKSTLHKQLCSTECGKSKVYPRKTAAEHRPGWDEYCTCIRKVRPTRISDEPSSSTCMLTEPMHSIYQSHGLLCNVLFYSGVVITIAPALSCVTLYTHTTDFRRRQWRCFSVFLDWHCLIPFVASIRYNWLEKSQCL